MNQEIIIRLGAWRDKTYCASPECNNECGRKMSAELETIAKNDRYQMISYSYFCGGSIPINQIPIDITTKK